ncbi:hydrophobic/amphiphilic exporter-1, HAE1 family [Geoalkalibacter ferrihydriticus]|uniref:Hydrophobic/amphiphilic exporter-1, HAE1 family n=1 Tax=Geoalkalibacter ferrihydriticus TaxID=392333 RepID=A0A1G9NBE7_9BACT|nr:efflux RND transporter permease subunit [Geoalkalibacter ferrihydriticus]SDL83447.1 hydrophobic/amphiphilic exporter-1, HAE1 family [Geoalkalibacter ferrihydriticus]
MFLSHISIKRPVTATMLVAALVIFGLIGLSRLGVSLFPDVDYPMVTVTTVWDNARPEEVDNEITDQLEDAIAGVSGIKHIISQSMEGRSRITVEFELHKDLDIAAQEVRDKVSARLRRLPSDADVPVVDKLDINAQPIMWLAVTGQRAIEDLTLLANEQVRPILQKIDGVGEVRLGGAREKQVHVRLLRERLAAYGIGVDEVIDAIRRQHVEVPGGKIESAEKEFLIRTVGEFETPEEFNNVIVAHRGGTPVRLGQLGYAEAGRTEDRPAGRFTNRDGVERTAALGITPRSGANEVAIAREVRALLPEIRAGLPEGMAIHVATDTTRFIEQSIDEIKFQLVLGGLAAAFVILLFLQNIRTTIISAIAIPTSIIATFACMYAMGFTMNNMSMLALVLAVGLVIDDAIVMVENIFRHRTALDKGPMLAAYDGSKEIGFAIISTTLAMAGVFLPVAFMGGMIGRFFFEFSVTVAFAIACSTFVALTLVPMLSSRFLKRGSPNLQVFRVFDRVMAWAADFYRRWMRRFLAHRVLVMLMALVALVAGGWMFNILGKEFITEEDQSRFVVRLQTPLSYAVDKTDEVMQRAEERMREIPEISHFFSFTGWGGANRATAFVTLVPKSERERTQREIQTEVRQILRQMPDVRGSATPISPLGGGQRNEDIQFVIQGPDLGEIDRISREVMNRLEETAGYSGITRDLEIGKPEVRVRIDREKAAEAGISARDIATAVGALLGGVDVATYREGGRSYDVRLRLLAEQRVLPTDIERIFLRGGDGTLRDISNFASIEEGVGPSVINRLDRQRSATVYANLEGGKVLGAAMPEVMAIAGEILPEGYTTKFSGAAETFQETGQYILFAFLLAILLTYMVLAAQFESFSQPFAIMMGLPLSFLGAFGLLWIMGNTFNLFSMIGLVLLIGLVTKNGILLIDYTNQLRRKGMDVHDALVEAGATRLRPILMTAISTIAGVLPVAIGFGEGSESRQPMAVAITGGLLSSTFLTLAVLPVMYSYLDQAGRWSLLEKFKGWLIARDEGEKDKPAEKGHGKRI